jgi:hypothetical protein
MARNAETPQALWCGKPKPIDDLRRTLGSSFAAAEQMSTPGGGPMKWAGHITLRSKALFLTLMPALALTGLTGEQAAFGAGQKCSFSADVDVTPGFSATPSSGTFTTNGPTGRVSCGGGEGTMGFQGNYGTKDPDGCGGAFSNGNEGDGTFVMSTPGTGEVQGTFTFVFGTLSSNGGLVEGTFTGEKFSGTFQLSPTAGDCFSSPVSKGRVTGQGTLK